MNIYKVYLYISILLSITLFSKSGFSQDTLAEFYSKYITPQIVYKHLKVFAADSLEGRETGEEGMVKATQYFSAIFKEHQIKPANNNSFFQTIPFFISSGKSIEIKLDGKKYISGTDYYTSENNVVSKYIESELIFVGYGITDSLTNWNDYKNIDVSGKVVLILDGEPINKKGKYLFSRSKNESKWNTDWKRKVEIAKENKAAAILILNRNFKFNSDRVKKWNTKGKLKLYSANDTNTTPVIHISASMADELLIKLGTDLNTYEQQAGKSKNGYFFSNKNETTISINSAPEFKNCRNVVGYIEGSDKKEEYIIISAHLDHLGVDGDNIYNGADDNGSGCSSLLNIAQAFSIAAQDGHAPSRSILFVAFSGEEKGLLGSEYYVSNPVWPIDKAVANLNVDMIGRVDTIDRPSKFYTYIIGSNLMSKDLHEVNESANRQCCKLDLDYRYNDPNHKLKLYSRSDHYNFVKNGVPAIFYFTGLHDDYHKPTDTIDKVDMEKTAAIARLIFNTAWELANRDQRVTIDKPGE